MDSGLVIIAAVFMLAGFVKGTLGLGLPTIAIGLLALRMPPVQALAITIVPAIVTNIWQAFAGPYMRQLLQRLWPLLVGSVVGVWASSGLLTGPLAQYGAIFLGILLVIYAGISLAKVHFTVAPAHEKPIGAVVGLLSGVISSFTGVQIMPSMPFLNALGLHKDEFVQGLGLFFMAATLAMVINLSAAGLMNASVALPGLTALVCSFAGMFLGQLLRDKMQPVTFRRWFLISLVVFGLYLTGNTLAKLISAYASGTI